MRDWIKWLLVVILVVSACSLLKVYTVGYVAEAHLAYALPLAVVTGLSAIALAIHSKR